MTDDRPVVDIRDPALDGQDIARRVLAAAQAAPHRPDPDALGAGLLQPDPAARPGPAAPSAGFPGLRDSLAELIGRSGLWEPAFHSSVPVVGPLIVAVRRLWNWMSAKWYVRPILWQQSDLNARTAHLLSDLAQWHELDARRIHDLESRLAALEARLSAAAADPSCRRDPDRREWSPSSPSPEDRP